MNGWTHVGTSGTSVGGRRGAAAGAALALVGGSTSALLVGLAAGPAGAVGATYTVDTLDDGTAQPTDCSTPVAGSCSLRDAIAASDPGDSIVFEPSLSGSLTITDGPFTIDHDLTIDGTTAAVIIDGSSSNGQFDLCRSAAVGVAISNLTLSGTSGRSAIVDNGCTTLTLDHAIVSGNTYTGFGAALYQASQSSSLRIVDSVFAYNESLHGRGGAVYAVGSVSVERSTFTANTAYYGGGAIAVMSDQLLSISDSTFSGNTSTTRSGGAIASYGSISVERSTFNANTAFYFGGAIAKYSPFNLGNVAISDSTFTDNSTLYGSGGAIYIDHGNSMEASTITSSTFTGNTAYDDAGAVVVTGNGDLTITASTFSANSSGSHGGAVLLQISEGSGVIVDSTFTENTASSLGGGLCIGGYQATALIANSTFADNSAYGGGGITSLWGTNVIAQSTIVGNHASSSGDNSSRSGGVAFTSGISTLSISGSIIAGNDDGDGSADLGLRENGGDPVITVDDSVLGSVDPRLEILTTSSNLIGITDPGVGPLSDNGGPTRTMALRADSPARDAGPAVVVAFPGNLYDQRGVGYARVVGSRADAGAYEIQPVPEPDPIVPHFTG